MDVVALANLWNLTQLHRTTSSARTAAGILLGLYNGRRFQLDLTDLRVLDRKHLEAALAVIKADAGSCQMEVHEWLNQLTGRRDFGARFEQLAHEYRLKGRCKRDHLTPFAPASLVINVPPMNPSTLASPVAGQS